MVLEYYIIFRKTCGIFQCYLQLKVRDDITVTADSLYPAGLWRQNNVNATTWRRNKVVLTS